MKQASLDLSLSVKKTRKREFLEQMDKVVPWTALETQNFPIVRSRIHVDTDRRYVKGELQKFLSSLLTGC